MSQTATIHIKVEPEMAKALKRLARSKARTVGELVRRALVACYQVDSTGISETQRQALEAYRGSFISLGKLSEVMGKTALEMRVWLNEHGIVQKISFIEQDICHA